MMKPDFIAALGMLIVLISCPVQADESIRDVKQAKLRPADATQVKVPSKEFSSTLPADDDPEKKEVDCFYLEFADDPFCKKINK